MVISEAEHEVEKKKETGPEEFLTIFFSSVTSSRGYAQLRIRNRSY